MDYFWRDHSSISQIVDIKKSTPNCRNTDITDNTLLPCERANRTRIPDNIPSAMTSAIYDKSLHNDSSTSHEADVPNTAASIALVTEATRSCWSNAGTHTDSAGSSYQAHECTDSRQIFFSDAITTEDNVGGETRSSNVTRDLGVDSLPETTEILCDYASVCDDDNLYTETVLPLPYDDDQCKLLGSKKANCPVTDHLTTLNEHHLTSKEVNYLALSNKQCNNITKVSDTLAEERTCSEVTPVSTVAAVYITSLLNHKSAMSECSLPANRELLQEIQSTLPAVCVPSPQFSPLVPNKLSELPPVSLPPIFYISVDETLPVNLYAAEKPNTVVKSELPNVNPRLAERCDSQLSAYSEKQDICRICHCEAELANKLISPCLCSGSLKYIHLCCLQKWIKSSDKKSCELCNFDYIMTMKIRPFKQWERLDMTVAERRKIVCSVTFHVIAITCVIWSLYVLIDRTTEEVNAGTLDWPFWTKLIVVAIGFTGGLVFMYVQCKMYLQLCLRWRQFNKLINVENAPEDVHLRAEAAARIKARSHESGGVVNTVALQEVDSF